MKRSFLVVIISCPALLLGQLSSDNTIITIKNDTNIPFAYLRFKVKFEGPHTSPYKSFKEKGFIRASATDVDLLPGMTKELDVLKSVKKIRNEKKEITDQFVVTDYMNKKDMKDIELLALVLYKPEGDKFRKLKTSFVKYDKIGIDEASFRVFARGDNYFVEAGNYAVYKLKMGNKLKSSLPVRKECPQ